MLIYFGDYLKISYGMVALAISLLYLGFSIGMYSSGIITDIVLIFAGLLTLIGIWTLIYAFIIGKDMTYWLVNGSLITLFSLALFTFKATNNIGYAFSSILIGIGVIMIIYLLRR